jgi:hypothetical protein
VASDQAAEMVRDQAAQVVYLFYVSVQGDQAAQVVYLFYVSVPAAVWEV